MEGRFNEQWGLPGEHARGREPRPVSAQRVAVLAGGRSSEHEVSLASGASVAEGLRADIADDRMADGGQVHANLVCATSLQLQE